MSYLQYALYYVIFIVLPLRMHKGVSIPLYRISSYLMHCHFPRIRYLQRDLLKTERSTSDMGKGPPYYMGKISTPNTSLSYIYQ